MSHLLVWTTRKLAATGKIVIIGIRRTVETLQVTGAKRRKDCPSVQSHNPKRRSRRKVSQEGASVAVIHTAEEQLRNLTSKEKAIGKGTRHRCGRLFHKTQKHLGNLKKSLRQKSEEATDTRHALERAKF